MKTIMRISLVVFLCTYPCVLEAQAANEPRAATMRVLTPLGPDVLRLVGFTGSEGLSSLFRFQLDLVAENMQPIPFEALLGKEIRVSLAVPGAPIRHFNGICARISQGDRGKLLTRYHIEVVPPLWLLTRTARSRIFQEASVPEIIGQILSEHGIVHNMEGVQGTFHPRTYVVQYRESDFAFVSRLLEEEGIFYFFRHTEQGLQLVLANTPAGHPDVPGSGPINYSGSKATDDRRIRGREETIYDWTKTQELRAGKYTLWDHSFELPQQNLEASATIQEQVQAGTVLHALRFEANANLEIYDYPGEYAQRFDGVAPNGAERPAELAKIFEDNQRTVGIRMQEEAAASLIIQGTSTSRRLVAGHKFTLAQHFNADGEYVLTAVTHTARIPEDREPGSRFEYSNTFTCIPASLPYRPARKTPPPRISGTQTAVVVGPAGEEIFTDKYGRVKVQFYWDRVGQQDDTSSCWVRVGALNAGQEFGLLHIPRIGEEVVVSFLEGDPDRPIIVGSVFNPLHPPPVVESR